MFVSQAEEMNPLRRCTMEDCCVVLGPDAFREINQVPPVPHANGTNGDHIEDDERQNGQDELKSSSSPKSSWNYLAVYDGHGGRDVVDFLQHRLANNLVEELKVPDDTSVLQRMERTYLLTDIESHLAGIKASGATVVTCLVRHHDAPASCVVERERNVRDESTSQHRTRRRRLSSDRHGNVMACAAPSSSQNTTIATIYTANCGDARAVLYPGGGKPAQRLSHDHKAEDPKEIHRIESSGGFVLRGRVLGVLAVARSLGDHGFKEYVIAKPHLSQVDVEITQNCAGSKRDGDGDSSNEDEPFVVLACDGLWDVASDQEVVDLVKDAVTSPSSSSPSFDKENDRNNRGMETATGKKATKGESKAGEKESRKEEVAQMLIEEALKRGSCDNISVIVAWL